MSFTITCESCKQTVPPEELVGPRLDEIMAIRTGTEVARAEPVVREAGLPVGGRPAARQPDRTGPSR